MTDLSIIIVSYNTKDLTLDCINSVIKNTKSISYEIVVVDNGSSDGSVNEVKKSIKSIRSTKGIKGKIIINKKNLGFGRANNIGIREACGKYVLLLNSDCLIHDNVLGEMVEFLSNHPEIGVATCALMDKSGNLQGTGGYFPNLFRVFSWMTFLDDIPILDRLIKPFHPMHGISPVYSGRNFYKKARQIDWITGAFMLIRKKVLDEVGGFDEDYFMYTEETDLCFRIKKNGWEIWYLPKWHITHLGGASSTHEFPIISEYKGIKLFFKKHKPSWQFPILRFFLKSGAFLRMAVFGLLKGRRAYHTYVKAFQVA